MRALRFALLALLRDWRSGELAVLLAALLVAVTALTGVGFFTDRIGQAVEQRAAEVIAADLRLRSGQPLAATYETLAAERDIDTARTITFPSVVFFGGDSALAAVRAVGPGYPLRGRIKISDAPFEPARETDKLPARGEIWLDSRLLARLGARIGDKVSVGARAFVVTQRARLPAGPGFGLRRSRALAADSACRPGVDGTARSREPRDLFTPLCRHGPRRYVRSSRSCTNASWQASGWSMSPRKARRSSPPRDAQAASSISRP